MKKGSQYVAREIETDIRACLKLPEIIAVTGARQCGKTTLFNKIISTLPCCPKTSRTSCVPG